MVPPTLPHPSPPSNLITTTPPNATTTTPTTIYPPAPITTTLLPHHHPLPHPATSPSHTHPSPTNHHPPTLHHITHSPDKVHVEIMTNDDDLESNLLTSSLLKCVLVQDLLQVELCVYCPVAGDELIVSVFTDLTLQFNLFSGNRVYWLSQFTQKCNGQFMSILSYRCGRSKCEC